MTPDILLVEDDADIRQTIGEVLEEEGYRVTTAKSGSRIAQVKSRPAEKL